MWSLPHKLLWRPHQDLSSSYSTSISPSPRSYTHLTVATLTSPSPYFNPIVSLHSPLNGANLPSPCRCYYIITLLLLLLLPFFFFFFRPAAALNTDICIAGNVWRGGWSGGRMSTVAVLHETSSSSEAYLSPNHSLRGLPEGSIANC